MGECSTEMVKNTNQTLKHPSADAVTQNVHKSDITAFNTIYRKHSQHSVADGGDLKWPEI